MTLFDGFRRLWTSQRSRCERSSVLVLLLICATTVFSTAIVQSLVVVLTASVIVCRFRHPSFRRTPLDLPYAAFLAARIISIAFSRNRTLSLSALYIEYFFYLVFFLVTQTLDEDHVTGSHTVVSVVTLAAVVAALVGVAKVLLSFSPAASSTTAGPYTLGAYLCAALPLALLVHSPRQSTRDRSVQLVSAAVICLGITLTLDRLHWGGMLFILLVAAWYFRRRILLISLAVPVIATLIFPQVRLRLETLLHLSHYMAGRDIIWRGAMQLLDRHPIVGFGPRTFSEIFPLFNQMWIPGVSSWHNDYLQVYMESGLLALIPLLWLIFTVYHQGWKAMRSSSLGPDRRNLLLAIGLSLTVMFLIGGMLDTLVGITFRTLLGVFGLLVSPAQPIPHARESGANNKKFIVPFPTGLSHVVSRKRHVS